MVANEAAAKVSEILGYDIHQATGWKFHEGILFTARRNQSADFKNQRNP